MPAKYLVTMPPGAPIDGVGFVQVGQIFTAPADYVPSLTFRPVNDEALKILEKVFSDRKAELLKRRDRAKDLKRVEDAEALTQHLEDLEKQRKKNLHVFTPKEKLPVVEEGVTLAQLAKLEAETQAAVGPKVDASDPKGGAATKGDRKL